MPTASYRRRLRNSHYMTTSRYVSTVPAVFGIMSGDDDVVKTQQYFFQVIDSIINYNNFVDSAKILQDIIHSTSSLVEFYKILDEIEANLLSTMANIADGVSSGIICARIEYIKTIIGTLPPNQQSLGFVADMTLQVLDAVIGGVDWNNIRSNLTSIQEYINDKYGDMDKITMIQNNLIDIICNIKDGVSSGIICARVDYTKTLIAEL